MLCTAQYCAKLSLPSNGTLSTDLVVYGSVVRVRCDDGFMMTDGNVSQSVECIDVNNSVAWNESIDDCLRKYILISTLY